MTILNIFMLIIYMGTAVFAVHNIYKYCYKQARWKTFAVGFFYLFALVVLVTRMAEYSLFIAMTL